MHGVNRLIAPRGVLNDLKATITSKFENFYRLQVKCEDESVFLESIYAAYTSQTCSKCGHKDKRSRNGETFICMSCSHSIDADINAALNILDRSTNVSGQKHTNKQGAHSPLARAVSGIKSNNL